MIADEEHAREAAKGAGRDREAPGRLERTARPIRGDPRHERAVEMELVDHPAARSILLRIGDEHVATELLNVEGDEAAGEARIREGARTQRGRREVLIDDVDGALTEVRGVEQ